jgi:hypothetical protein
LAMERLMAEGLDRHDAVHAVASVVAEQMWEVLSDAKEGGRSRRKGGDRPTDSLYSAAVERLTAESWRREFSEDGDTGMP